MIIKGTAYIDGQLEQRCIGIKNGRIEFIKKCVDKEEDVFYWDGVVLPAGTDIHVHFREPGMTHKEDFYTGSLSAAFGGITTYADMPNTEPKTSTLDSFEKKKKLAHKKSVLDYALYGYVESGASELCGETDIFKVYMSSSTGTKRSDYEDEVQKITDKGGKIAYHCETEELFRGPAEDLKTYNGSRPTESEVEAIKSLAALPGDKHVCHVTTKKAIEAAQGHDRTNEVTPHHLFLSEDVFLGPYGKVNPPLRSQNEQIELWKAMDWGKIDIIASDHAPHLEEEKQVDFEEAPAGIPGVETMYPMMMNAVAFGKISLDTVVKAIAEKPAEFLGIKKGKIEEGYYADLAFFDFRENIAIDPKDLHSRCGWTPYNGFRAVFPQHVMSRGEFLVEDFDFAGEKGRGKYVKEL